VIPQLAHLSRAERRQAILFMEKENAKWPAELTPVPEAAWPASPPGHHQPVGVWRSREFVAQVFQEADGVIRLSVNRTHIDPADLRWVDGITWDELQALKRQVGLGDRFAVEVYPADLDVVNVGNLRHLWVLPASLSFAWRRNDGIV
jgi:hypothetical protein